MQTIIGLNSPIAVKRYSATLFNDTAKLSYFGTRFMSKAADAPTPIQVLTELESDAGDTINYDLFVQLTQKPTYGDQILRGKEEALKNFSDKLQIDQVRCGVNGGGRMTRKRTLHDLRAIGRQKISEWWARWGDEVRFIYASGARGSNADYIEDPDYAGFAGNPLQPPDADHLMFGGDATSFATISNDDEMTLKLIDRAVARAETMGGGVDGKIKVRPIRVNAQTAYVCTMHTWQAYSLRTGATSLEWADLQKSAAANDGQKNPLFTGAMGMYNGVVLHKHQNVIRFNNAGSDQKQPAARALFWGAQALTEAYGSPGSGLRFDWNEETDDRGNQIIITTAAIMGIKKTTFNGKWFSAIALDTYADDPG